MRGAAPKNGADIRMTRRVLRSVTPESPCIPVTFAASRIFSDHALPKIEGVLEGEGRDPYLAMKCRPKRMLAKSLLTHMDGNSDCIGWNENAVCLSDLSQLSLAVCLSLFPCS